jgi:hypothetical protein
MLSHAFNYDAFVDASPESVWDASQEYLRGEVVESDRPHLFKYRDGGETFSWRFEREGDGTRLRLVHDGLSDEGRDAAERDWPRRIDELKQRLAA